MLPPEFWPVFVAGCARIDVDPIDLLAVAANESGLKPGAWNEGGRAAGLWQLTPAGAGAAGWPKDQTHRFSTLTAVEQWPFWEHYFGLPWRRGKLVNKAACYVCTGWPAGLSIAGISGALLCSADGRTDIPLPKEYPHGWPKAEVIGWYNGNRGFDRKKTGEIRVRDLTAAIDRSTLALGGAWADCVAAIHREQARVRDTKPELDVTDGGNCSPLYMSPEQPERDPVPE